MNAPIDPKQIVELLLSAVHFRHTPEHATKMLDDLAECFDHLATACEFVILGEDNPPKIHESLVAFGEEVGIQLEHRGEL
mgnify:CR=1 FL=1|jgi:hypothetical protein|tara:strand:+ start:902 stop:1141 length:240 start_codon:yes stop_codon:yes gene_type:complete